MRECGGNFCDGGLSSDAEIVRRASAEASALAAALFCCLLYGGALTAEKAVCAVFLAVLAAVDWKFGILPDKIIGAFAAFILLPRLWQSTGHILGGDGGSWDRFSVISGVFADGLCAAAVLAGGFFFLRLVSRGGVGLGDVKFAAALGWWLGTAKSLFAVALAFALAFLFAVFIAARAAARGESVAACRRLRLPFGPFLALGSFLALLTSL